MTTTTIEYRDNIQRISDLVIRDHVTSWPDEPASQRVWALSFAQQVSGQKLRFSQDEDEPDPLIDLIELSDRIIDYINEPVDF